MKTFAEGAAIGVIIAVILFAVFTMGWLSADAYTEAECENFGASRLDSGVYTCKRAE